jgi:hypothetical protein
VSLPINLAGREFAEAYLEIVEPETGDPRVPFRFNPAEYRLSKENTYAEIPIPGLDTPPLQYVRGGAEVLSFDLLLDTSDDLSDVREKYVDKLRELVSPNPQLHAPAIVDFYWAEQVFRGVVQSLQVTYTLFHTDGTPLRARCALQLKEYRPVEIQVREPPRSSSNVEKRYVARAGETLSGIAAAVYRDPARWRHLAVANGITDPRRVEPGTVLLVPRLTGGAT